ncbi:MAG: type I-B CRISPR-associated protein Cas5 [Spirochaetales bacterium]|nr:type I-B CRISPR-associated protein Cas5 [Spirochaetales bacterium]
MGSVKVLVFDLFADYGFLKKNYTTMSPLSFSILPRTVICGIIGAIIGIDKENNPEAFNDCFITQKINNKIKKICIPYNLLKTTSIKHFSRFENHKPTNIEFLKDLNYRIYFSSKDTALYNKLKQQLEGHKSFYTISIGSAHCLADYTYFRELNAEEKKGKSKSCIYSIIPADNVKEIEYHDLELFLELLPNTMKNDREVTEYKEFIFELSGKPVCCQVDEYWSLESGESIVPM